MAGVERLTSIILAEKPQQARKIESVVNLKTVPLVGHLLELHKKDFHWTPPYFNIEWRPKRGKKEKLEKVIELVRNLDKIIIATDYDTEGQLIALNILRQAGVSTPEVKRMRFSSLEREEILKSFRNLVKFDKIFALKAEVRHYLDWYYGKNISKTLTMIRRSKRFRLTPVGRVQTPTLNFLVDREKEISMFKPEELWYAQVKGLYGENSNKVFDICTFTFKTESEARLYTERVLTSRIDRINKNQYQIENTPPNTDDIIRFGMGLGLNAATITKVLQDLYLNEYCSYPRTDSKQYLSHGVDTQKYIKPLVGVIPFAEDAIGKEPNEGEETDIHPAIYPVRVYPEKDLTGVIWKEIATQFVKCHLPPEQFDYKELYVEINGKLQRSINCPDDLDEGAEIDLVYEIGKGKTSPPNRHKQIDVYNWMTSNKIGTRDTRPQIVTKIFRTYAYETKSGACLNSLAMKVIGIVMEYSPTLVSPVLTRNFEEMISSLQSIENEDKVKTILKSGRQNVTEIVKLLFENKEEISKLL